MILLYCIILCLDETVVLEVSPLKDGSLACFFADGERITNENDLPNFILFIAFAVI